MRAIFYDTWAFIALANAGDPHHAIAVEADERAVERGYVGVTSDWILDETLTGLHASLGARVALAFLDAFSDMVDGEQLTLVHVSTARREAAIQMFKKLAADTPRLSLTDCSSFTIMRELQIPWAFTGDRHFGKAGKGLAPLFTRTGHRLVFSATLS